MKYDNTHIPNFVGARGECSNCGLEVTLERQDVTVQSSIKSIWIVKCPHCKNEIRTVKLIGNSYAKYT